MSYNGSIAIAKKVVEVAAKAGADIVKLKTRITENSLSIYHGKTVEMRQEDTK